MPATNFFEATFGFPETSYAETRARLLEMAHFTPGPGGEGCDFRLQYGNLLRAGRFSMPSVQELHHQVQAILPDTRAPGVIRFSHMVGEARSIHTQLKRGDVIQAASQFNLLEFPGPRVVPEDGIRAYESDRTQGPACAVACAAGTAYRNYLVPTPNGTRGQTHLCQLNGLIDVHSYLMNELGMVPWDVTNGYTDSSSPPDRLERVNQYLADTPSAVDILSNMLRIGVQDDTVVTDLAERELLVTQTYNSALSIGYSILPPSQWNRLWGPSARMVLNGSYEATLLVGVLNTIRAARAGEACPIIYLTKVGGGVFSNDDSWIVAAIVRAMKRVRVYGVALDVRLVHFRQIDPVYNVIADAL